MNKQLINLNAEVLEKWKELKDINSARALEYYFESILPSVADSFIRNNHKEYQCDTLVSLMGFSPETTALTASALRPAKLIVITGANTLNNYDLVVNFLVMRKVLKHHQIRLEEIDVSDLDDIYNVVSKCILNKECSNVIIDITGGKKIMSASAAQAAWEIDAPLCYVEGDYDPELRRPHIGTERLAVLKNPSIEKARQARRDALIAWNMRQFSLAKDLFVKSRNLNSLHNFEEIAIPLCEMYDALYNFDLELFRENHHKICILSKCDYLVATIRTLGIDALLKVFTDDLCFSQPINKIAVFLSISNEYASLNRFDFAALLSYRALEAITSYGLNLIGNNSFDPSKPDYAQLTQNVDDFEQRYFNFRKKINKNDKCDSSLPYKIGFMDGVTILAILKPEFVFRIYSEESLKLEQIVSRIRGISDSRNQSILAHGVASLGKDKYIKINELASKFALSMFGDELIDMISAMSPPKLELALS